MCNKEDPVQSKINKLINFKKEKNYPVQNGNRAKAGKLWAGERTAVRWCLQVPRSRGQGPGTAAQVHGGSSLCLRFEIFSSKLAGPQRG